MATFQKIRIEVPFTLTLPTVGNLISGSPNPFYPLVLFMNDNTPKRDRWTVDGVTYVYNCEVILEMFDLALIGLVVQQGGEVYGLPLFFPIDLAATVPDRLKERDEADQAIDRTWQEYFDATPTVAPSIDPNGNAYIGTNVFDPEYVSASAAIVLVAEMGVELLTLPDLQQLLNPPA